MIKKKVGAVEVAVEDVVAVEVVDVEVGLIDDDVVGDV